MERRGYGEAEASFKAEQTKLESYQSEAKELVESRNLDEKDILRLTRVLQLVDRYRPEHLGSEEELAGFNWLDYLKTLHRFLPLKKKKPEKQEPLDASAHSYLLAEDTIRVLRNLRHLDKRLEKETKTSADELINQERDETIIRKEVIDSSLTLDYEKKNWGVERVCLDGIQNHLPSDSKGSQVLIRFLVNGNWVTIAEAKNNSDRISAVRFADDGVGFDVKNLDLLYSTKSDEDDSRGQFGEGMKMMAAAAVREGLELEFESQTWRAVPGAKTETLRDTRNGTDRNVQRLSFDIEHLEGEPMIGSRTTFHKPSPEFIAEALLMEEKVLALREKYKPLFTSSAGDVVDRNSGKIFVKGIFVTEASSIFSYDFNDVETNRDRNAIIGTNIEARIIRIIEQLNSKTLIKTLLKKSLLNPDAIECCDRNIEPAHPEIWKDAFYEAFGTDTVVETGFKVPEIFKDTPIKKIKFPSAMTRVLLSVGVKSDRESIPDFFQETIPTSYTSENGKDVWEEERIILDAVQNHLPHDSGGSSTGLRFKTKDGQWHLFRDLADTSDEDIELIKITDNGRGYDHRMLGFTLSDKESTEASGKFGEGLKMLSLATLRKGMSMRLSSRNWTASPRFNQQEIDGKQVQQLVFEVTHAVKNQKLDGDTDTYSVSTTSFENPSPEMISEFRKIHEKVLALDNRSPLEYTSAGDILALNEGSLFVRQILIPGDHDLLFSYHFPKLEIKNRDRNTVAKNELEPAVKEVLQRVSSPEIIRNFLLKATIAANPESRQGRSDAEKLEFGLSFMPQDREQWKTIFQEMFGKDTAIRSVTSQDFNEVHQNLHVGLSMITVPEGVYRVLIDLGLPSYHDRIGEMTNVDSVAREAWTAEEERVVEFLKTLDQFLPDNRPSEVILYNPKKEGQHLARGFSDGRAIHLHREEVSLKNLVGAADVYFHEKTHHNTGAADADAGYRNYLTMALAKFAIEQLRQKNPELVPE